MATWDRYKQATTGFETKSFLGDIFTIRSYCDIHGGGVYDTKEPICKLLVAPLSVFINVDFSWDISQSGSESGTLDTYDIDFDGATSGGDISSAAWAGAKTGTNQFTSKGHYTIVASVTDTLGNKSKEVRIPIVAIDGADEDSGADDDYNSLQRVYKGTTDSGCWIVTPTVAPYAANTGLAGDDLKFRDLAIDHETKDLIPSRHFLVAAVKTGVAYSVDGAANWTLISKAALGDPVNTAGDGTPPVTADLDQVGVAFDPKRPTRIYVLRTKSNRAWLYYSDNNLASWNNVQIGNGVGQPAYTFTGSLDGWTAITWGSVAYDGADGDAALGCMKVTPEVTFPTYSGWVTVPLASAVVGIVTYSIAVKAAVVTPFVTIILSGPYSIAETPALTFPADSAWHTLTGTFVYAGGEKRFTQLTLKLRANGANWIKYDDVEILGGTFNVTHSAGGMPGRILI